MSRPLSDDELLGGAGRDPERFGVFYERYERLVMAYFMRRARDAELAADLTAETFAAALISARRYRATGEPAGAWLLGIARHKWLRSLERRQVEDRARKQLRMPPLDVDEQALSAFDRLSDDDVVDQLLRRLPDEQAAAIRARIVDDASYDEVARLLRCSPSVARKRVSRGLTTLRESMEERP